MVEKKKLVPELRFPEFDGEWESIKLGKRSSKIGSGKTPRGGSNVYIDSGIPFIRSQNIKDNRLELDETHISDAIHTEMSGSKVLSNDILLNITGASIGRSCVVPNSIKEANVNQHVCIIRLKTDDPRFMQLYLSSWHGQKLIFEAQTGSGREGLNFESIRKFQIPLPTLPEQQKIAGFLSAIDKRIQLLQKKKEHLEIYKKGVMQQIYSQKIRFKDENGQDFPDWEEKKLGEVGSTYGGLTGKSKEHFGNGKPYVQYMQIFSDSVIRPEDFGYVEISKNEKQNRVRYGDMFFTTSSETPNEIGTASVILSEVDEVYLNSFCFGYRPKSLEVLDPNYSRYLFRSTPFRSKIIVLAQGSTRFNMSKVELMKLTILLPHIKEQLKIADLLSNIDASIEQLTSQLESTQSFKKGLLQKMFV
ncbi:MAG TPA: restriction endonuclease subunit S [Bacteroidetes bacterium]|nr:restriction endonuclease subunit S [Bacteroidota bacterium]